MSHEKKVTCEEVDHILETLPGELDSLLERCGSVTPPYTPDIVTFTTLLGEFLKPLIQYTDEQFHAGNPEDAPALDALRFIASRKLDLERKLKSDGENAHFDESRAMAYTGFKLLIAFFCYTSANPGPAMIDLQYQFEMEEDPARKNAILEQARRIFAGTSTAKLNSAHALFERGKLDEALAECTEAITQFKENTNAYDLKARILSAMSRQSLEDGLKAEPRDVRLQSARALQQMLEKLRADVANSNLDIDSFAERLAQSTKDNVAREGVVLKPYEAAIWKRMEKTKGLSEIAMIFLATGEYLLQSMPPDCDHAPAGLEFCKALEMELERLVFLPFKQVAPPTLATRNLAKVDIERTFHHYCYSEKTVTLGGMAFIVGCTQNSKNENRPLFGAFSKHLLAIFGSHAAQLADSLGQEEIDTFRNSAAHPALYNSATARDAAKWVYTILNLLISALPDGSS